jgi:hypothetical protein
LLLKIKQIHNVNQFHTLDKKEMQKLKFSIGDLTIIKESIPFKVDGSPQNYIYLQELNINWNSGEHSVTIKLYTNFEKDGITPMKVFETSIDFLLYNFTPETSEKEIHNLFDVALNKHLKTLQDKVWDFPYRSLLNTSPDSYRFTNHIENKLSHFWQNNSN